jgi:hypothetical protein
MMWRWKNYQKQVQDTFPLMNILAGPKVRFNPFPRQILGKLKEVV